MNDNLAVSSEPWTILTTDAAPCARIRVARARAQDSLCLRYPRNDLPHAWGDNVVPLSYRHLP